MGRTARPRHRGGRLLPRYPRVAGGAVAAGSPSAVAPVRLLPRPAIVVGARIRPPRGCPRAASIRPIPSRVRPPRSTFPRPWLAVATSEAPVPAAATSAASVARAVAAVAVLAAAPPGPFARAFALACFSGACRRASIRGQPKRCSWAQACRVPHLYLAGSTAGCNPSNYGGIGRPPHDGRIRRPVLGPHDRRVRRAVQRRHDGGVKRPGRSRGHAGRWLLGGTGEEPAAAHALGTSAKTRFVSADRIGAREEGGCSKRHPKKSVGHLPVRRLWQLLRPRQFRVVVGVREISLSAFRFERDGEHPRTLR